MKRKRDESIRQSKPIDRRMQKKERREIGHNCIEIAIQTLKGGLFGILK